MFTNLLMKKILEEKAKTGEALSAEQTAALRDNPAADGVLKTHEKNINAKANAAGQARQQNDLRNSNYGSTIGQFGADLVANFSKRDENGNLSGDAELGAEAAGLIGMNLGDLGGAALRGLSWRGQAREAANTAGAFQDARSAWARDSIMGQAGERMGAMNAANAQTTAAMTDSAIGQANAFESGMLGIDASGIEGSSNMERNLQYGRDRGEAQEQFQYDLMGRDVQALENQMAGSFSDLSQMKAGVMGDAFRGSLQGNNAALTKSYIDTGDWEMKHQPNLNDYQAALLEAQDAKDKNPGAPAEEEAPPPGTESGQITRFKELDNPAPAGNEPPAQAQAQIPAEWGELPGQTQTQIDPPYAPGQAPPEAAAAAPAAPPAASAGKKPGADELINFYSQARSNQASSDFLGQFDMTDEQRREFDAQMAAFNKKPNREARMKWTRDFVNRLGA